MREWKDLLQSNVENALRTLNSHPESMRLQDLMLIAEHLRAAQGKIPVLREASADEDAEATQTKTEAGQLPRMPGADREGMQLLVQSFEGTLVDVNAESVIVEFEMGDRRELRKFPRAQFLVPELRTQDVVQLRCELSLAPPSSPLSDAEVEQWERDYADRAVAQAKTKYAKSLLGEDP